MKMVLTSMIAMALLGAIALTPSDEAAEVEAAVEALRLAMIAGDKQALEKLAADDLTYGHSSGYVENKAEFVQKLVSKASDFVSIKLSNQKLIRLGPTMIVRHDLDAETNDNGKPGSVSLHVLSVWQKQEGRWRMIARQATKRGH